MSTAVLEASIHTEAIASVPSASNEAPQIRKVDLTDAIRILCHDHIREKIHSVSIEGVGSGRNADEILQQIESASPERLHEIREKITRILRRIILDERGTRVELV